MPDITTLVRKSGAYQVDGQDFNRANIQMPGLGGYLVIFYNSPDGGAALDAVGFNVIGAVTSVAAGERMINEYEV